MALSLTQVPTTPAPVNQKLIFTATSTNVGETGFRFKYTVTIDGVAHVAYVPPNPANSGMLDIRPIIEKYVYVDNETTADGSIHRFSSVSNRAFNPNAHNFKQVTVAILEAWEVAGVLTDDPDTLGSVGANTYRIFAGSFQHYDGFNPAMTPYTLTDSNSYILSDRLGSSADYPSKWKFAPNYSISKGVFIPVGRSQYGVLAFQNWQNIRDWQYTIYNGTTVIGAQNITINAGNGLNAAALTNTVDGIGYLAAYPASVSAITVLQSAGLTPAQNVDATHYTWQALDGITQRSLRYVFFFDEECKYETIAIGWANFRGGWDYMNFRGKSTESVQADPKRYRRVLGDYNSASFNFEPYERGLTDFGREMKRTLTVTKKNMTAADYLLLKSLVRSQNVVIVQDPFSSEQDVPMILQNTSQEIDQMRRAGQKEVSLTFEYANEIW